MRQGQPKMLFQHRLTWAHRMCLLRDSTCGIQRACASIHVQRGWVGKEVLALHETGPKGALKRLKMAPLASFPLC
eukprot:1158848-Pelagomonas_calceolata.AAC.9